MNTYYCTHCGKKNAILGEDVPIAEEHKHSWFLTTYLEDGTEVHDCGCGERKRITHSSNGEKEALDSELYAVGSVNRALYER